MGVVVSDAVVSVISGGTDDGTVNVFVLALTVTEAEGDGVVTLDTLGAEGFVLLAFGVTLDVGGFTLLAVGVASVFGALLVVAADSAGEVDTVVTGVVTVGTLLIIVELTGVDVDLVVVAVVLADETTPFTETYTFVVVTVGDGGATCSDTVTDTDFADTVAVDVETGGEDTEVASAFAAVAATTIGVSVFEDALVTVDAIVFVEEAAVTVVVFETGAAAATLVTGVFDSALVAGFTEEVVIVAVVFEFALGSAFAEEVVTVEVVFDSALVMAFAVEVVTVATFETTVVAAIPFDPVLTSVKEVTTEVFGTSIAADGFAGVITSSFSATAEVESITGAVSNTASSCTCGDVGLLLEMVTKLVVAELTTLQPSAVLIAPLAALFAVAIFLHSGFSISFSIEEMDKYDLIGV